MATAQATGVNTRGCSGQVPVYWSNHSVSDKAELHRAASPWHSQRRIRARRLSVKCRALLKSHRGMTDFPVVPCNILEKNKQKKKGTVELVWLQSSPQAQGLAECWCFLLGLCCGFPYNENRTCACLDLCWVSLVFLEILRISNQNDALKLFPRQPVASG